MSFSRWRIGILLALGFMLPLWAQVPAQTPRKKTHKVIVYPNAAEVAGDLKKDGVEMVTDYGSFWVAEVNDQQAQALKKSRGDRLARADRLNRIELRAALVDTSVGEPTIPSYLRAASHRGKRLWLVQFQGPVLPEWLEMLKSAGNVKVVSYVPNNAYIVSMDEEAGSNLNQFVAPAGPIQWIGAYHPYYKIQPGLLQTQFGSGADTVDISVAVLDGPEADAALDTIRWFARSGASEPLVQLHQKVIKLTTKTADILSIAQIPEVLWIERVARRELKDEKQDLILASRTNQLPGHAPVPATLGGERYLDFLFDKVGGGLEAFTNSATYPIVDIADTGLETGTTQPAHPAFYELGNPTNASRVVAVTRAGYPDGDGCPPFTQGDAILFADGSDFCGHGTFVASIVNGYDDGTNETFACAESEQFCDIAVFGGVTSAVISIRFPTNTVTRVRKDTDGFQRGMGVSPFGLIAATRIFTQDLTVEDCDPFIVLPTDASCDFCATSLPVLMAQEYVFNRARISNNSWGDILTVTPDGQFVNAGQYTGDSQAYDIGTRDALQTGVLVTNVPGPSPLNQEMIFVFAGGNAGSVGNVGGFGDILVTAPATAKNIIAVGATENFRVTADGCFVAAVNQDNTFDISGFSAFGPTLDGRFKPDILAPGSSIFGANNLLAFARIAQQCNLNPLEVSQCLVGQGVQDCADLYTCNAGTSFAAPAVSGGAQLLWWYFQNRLSTLQPSPAMAKAYMLNAARYLPIMNPIVGTFDTLPSIAQGMGMMDLERMFDGVPRALRDQTTPRAIDVTLLLTNTVPQQTYFTRTGQSYEMQGVIHDATKPFRVSLAWTDVPGEQAANGALVNDLDLEVTVVGKTYKGNIFTGANSVIDISRDADNVNNIESVFLPPGQTGTWSVVVRAANIAGEGVPNVGPDLDQDFALVVYNTTTPSDVPNVSTNDACQTAAPITSFPYTTKLNLSSSVFHNNHPSPSTARGGIEAFWTLGRPTQNTVFSISTFGSNFDTVLSVWTGNCGALVEQISNNNSSNTLQSAVSFTADGSNTYYIVVDKRAGNSGTLVLNVSAVPPPISLTPGTLDFGGVFVGVTSAPLTATYTNGTLQATSIDGVLIQGADAADFVISDNNCQDQAIPAGGTCIVSIVFTPSHLGVHTATLIVADNQTGSPRILLLTGIGVAPSPIACANAGSLTFPVTATGATSTVQTVTITNCGVASMFVTNLILTGAAAGDYIISSDTCSGNSIPPDGTCDIGVAFAPTTTGTRVATLRVNSDATNSPTQIILTGVGELPTPRICFSPTSVNFGNTSLDSTTSVHSIVVSNCGTAPLVISAVSITGTNAGQFILASQNCTGGAIPIGGTCTIDVQFAPSVIGPASATLQITDNAAGSPHMVPLTALGAGSQPDAAIGKTIKSKKMVGNNVINSTGVDQEFTQKVKRGAKRGARFFMQLKNVGTNPDQFKVEGDGDSGGFTVKYFLGATDTTDISTAVESGDHASATLAPAAITGDATMIRIEVFADKTVLKGTVKTFTISFTSFANPSKVDVVKATVIAK